MGRMNTGRILLGGIVAGIVFNALDFVMQMYVFAEDGRDMIQRLNLDPAVAEASAPTWIVVNLALGLLMVFTYAAIRPRFGPGPKTAIVASMTIWAAITAVLSGFTAIGIFTPPAFMKHAAIYVVTSAIAALAGAAVYKE
jgi:hypothetical protein